MHEMNYSPVAQAFYLIRSRDVELAEDFLQRCPQDLKTFRELNAFFHRILSQYSVDTIQVRMQLKDTSSFNVWAEAFVSEVLPFFITHRFPTNTSLRTRSFYADVKNIGVSMAH